ncbi:MAG: hypothetical protein RLZZ136_749 [Pseudomonadota bacterium]|jgi:Ca2+-binding EF-hand superfamily protein
MKKLALALSTAALAYAGIASAAPQGDPMGDKTVTRAEAEAKARAMFDKLDVNHDDKLDRADREAHMADQFKTIDSDSNGAISPAEFKAAHEHAPGDKGPGAMGQIKHPMMAMLMLHKADTNHDNAVSRDEFVAAALGHFDKADANHDGQLTAQERRTAMKAMRDRMRAMRGQHGHEAMGDGPPPPM